MNNFVVLNASELNQVNGGFWLGVAESVIGGIVYGILFPQKTLTKVESSAPWK